MLTGNEVLDDDQGEAHPFDERRRIHADRSRVWNRGSGNGVGLQNLQNLSIELDGDWRSQGCCYFGKSCIFRLLNDGLNRVGWELKSYGGGECDHDDRPSVERHDRLKRVEMKVGFVF